MIKNKLTWRGRVVVEKRLNGRLVSQMEYSNLVVAAGRQLFAQLIAAVAATAPSHTAIGTGTTAVADGDTTLATELSRIVMTSRTASAGVSTYIANFPAGNGTGTLREAGIFNAGAAGTMAARVVFTDPVVKGAAEDVTITWVITAGSL